MNVETQPVVPEFAFQALRPRELASAALPGHLIRRAGRGHKGDAFRCWLAEHEPLLWPGDHVSKEEKEAWRQRCTAHARAAHGWTGPS